MFSPWLALPPQAPIVPCDSPDSLGKGSFFSTCVLLGTPLLWTTCGLGCWDLPLSRHADGNLPRKPRLRAFWTFSVKTPILDIPPAHCTQSPGFLSGSESPTSTKALLASQIFSVYSSGGPTESPQNCSSTMGV